MSDRLAFVRGHIAAEDYYAGSQPRSIQAGQPLGDFGETTLQGNGRLSFAPDNGSSQLNFTRANSLCFICPFQKYVGHTFYCGHFKRISDLRQHIRRVHVQPLHCPRCGEIFKGDPDRNVHIRQRECERVRFPPYPGITWEQWGKIHEAASLKQTKRDEVQRWNEMRQILFPGMPPTSEIYVEMVGTESFMLIRHFVALYRQHVVWNQSSESLDDFLDFARNPPERIQAERARSDLRDGARSAAGLAQQHSFSAQQATSSYELLDASLQPLARIYPTLGTPTLNQSLSGDADFYLPGAPGFTMAHNDSIEQSSNVGAEGYTQNPGFWSQT
ncbi:hypothetical protein DL771_003157 [Monosporascus sp. 5C6A]|nr:hypothetical protein DL771_003157 [Monosporascus sp. 5C6A]